MGLGKMQVRLTGRGFDLERRLLDVPESIWLLQAVTTSKKFKSLYKLPKWWTITFNDWRTQFKLQYATLDPDFHKILALTSHLAFGNGQDNSVFMINPENRDLDIVRPSMNQPFWSAYVFATNQLWSEAP